MSQIAWLAEHAPGAAAVAADQVDAAVELLGDFPLVAPAAGDRFRELPVDFGRDGFILRYKVTDVITIVRVFHGRRRR
jgi:plasmid stabilization system protein ParE